MASRSRSPRRQPEANPYLAPRAFWTQHRARVAEDNGPVVSYNTSSGVTGQGTARRSQVNILRIMAGGFGDEITALEDLVYLQQADEILQRELTTDREYTWRLDLTWNIADDDKDWGAALRAEAGFRNIRQSSNDGIHH